MFHTSLLAHRNVLVSKTKLDKYGGPVWGTETGREFKVAGLRSKPLVKTNGAGRSIQALPRAPSQFLEREWQLTVLNAGP